MGRKLEKCSLLMWKNLLLPFRRPCRLLMEVLMPVICILLLLGFRNLTQTKEYETKIYKPFCPTSVSAICEGGSTKTSATMDFLQNMDLIYSPSNNTQLDNAMKLFSIKDLKLCQNVIGYKNAKILEDQYIASDSKKIFAALQFDDDLGGKQKLPKQLNMKIRFPSELRNISSDQFEKHWQTVSLYCMLQMAGPRLPQSNTGANPSYYEEGFLQLQSVATYFLMLTIKFDIKSVISSSELKSMRGKASAPTIQMQRFPHNNWIEDPLNDLLKYLLPLLIVFSFMYTCTNTVRAIATEKELQLKEAMKMMGLPNWLHWLAWFLKTFLFLSISITLIVILLKTTYFSKENFALLTYSNTFLIFIFFLLYVSAAITFCFAISVFFSSANTAATVASFIWLGSYLPYMILIENYATLSLTIKIICCLLLNSAMGFGVLLITMFEGSAEGVQWNNLWKSTNPGDSLSLGIVMIILIIDMVIYLLIALYIEAVFPGEYGVPQLWYFPLSANYWRGYRPNPYAQSFRLPSYTDNEYFENAPEGLYAGIQIKNLRKIFNNKSAVKNLSLDMFQGQITVLLGHNGAGKTTTMSMLCGMFPPTNGTAIINGYDIRTNIDNIRDNLGYCPQHNILFDDLTVREHLYFFSKLKGVKKKLINKEINSYLEYLQLHAKANARTSTLSGGMKRRLCAGIALCGNSKIVMLDEPTAGIDPFARRAVWNLLQGQKEGRTMLLTTHFMDEADLLGDRIAIMADGELQCCGTSFFLKKKLGTGYRLIIDKSANCDVTKITEILRKYIPELNVHSDIGSELTYLLPEKYSTSFKPMLHDLEVVSESLGVIGYGISLTTMEEVFMKVGVDQTQEQYKYNNFSTQKSLSPLDRNTEHQTRLYIENAPVLRGRKLIKNQYLAMFMKKSLSSLRSWYLLLLMIIFPAIYLIACLSFSRSSNKSMDLPELPLKLKPYSDSITLISKQKETNLTKIYQNLVQSSNRQMNVVEDVSKTMLELTKTQPSQVKTAYIVGASFQESNVITWFNNDPYHSPPLALGLVLNAIYKNVLGDSDYDITFSNYPLPFSAKTKIQMLNSTDSAGMEIGFNLAMGLGISSCLVIFFYIKERASQSKHLQFVSGVKVYIFWTAAFICDLFIFIVITIIIIITLAAFQEPGFSSFMELTRIFLILLCYSVSTLPQIYLFSYLFTIPAEGFTKLLQLITVAGILPIMVIQIMRSPEYNSLSFAENLHSFFLLMPCYAMGSALTQSYSANSAMKVCKLFVDPCIATTNKTEDDCWSMACNIGDPELAQYCCDRQLNYYKWEKPGIGRNLYHLLAGGLVAFLLLMIIDYGIISCTKKGKPKLNSYQDSDVSAEKQKIYNTSLNNLINENTIILKDLTKYYKKFLAVNDLCLAIPQYECFGLLGVNGAGKTTTFKMMTGDIKMSYGDVWLKGYSVRNQTKSVYRIIGYCPQFDALLDDLTVRETLIIFALLRGISLDESKNVADKLGLEFDFHRHINKKIKELSGGNKRKVSTAIVLIGNPPVLYLDEPTAGMDPATKRYLWNALCKYRDTGKCIVLTSHHMDECEALCTRLAIMVQGEFKCLGSTQHLKNKFAEGYTLIIKIRKKPGSTIAQTRPVQEFVVMNFPTALLTEHHQELLTYYIKDKSIPCSKMFGILEEGKQKYDMEDYSLSQSSLEQVFLTFTQTEPEE